MKRIYMMLVSILGLLLSSTTCISYVGFDFANLSDNGVMWYLPHYFRNYPDTTFKKMYIENGGFFEKGEERGVLWSDDDSIEDAFRSLGADTLSLFIWRGYKYRYDNTELGDRDVRMLARYDLSASDLDSGIKITYPPSREMLNAGMKVTLIPEEESDRYPGFLEAYAPGRAAEE